MSGESIGDQPSQAEHSPTPPAGRQSLAEILQRVQSLVDDTAAEKARTTSSNDEAAEPASLARPADSPESSPESPGEDDFVDRSDEAPEPPSQADRPIENVTAQTAAPATAAFMQDTSQLEENFFPQEPTNFIEARVNEGEVEALALKSLLAKSEASGRALSGEICLPFKMVETVLTRLKNDQLVAYKSSAPMNDYVYGLTDLGRERARRHNETTTYIGAAPVALDDYIDAIAAQSIAIQHPTLADVERAFSDLLINKEMIRRLGPAMNSGRGMFLFGGPGNGKTSIAERVTAAFGESIWIPRAIGIEGAILRLFDPMNHEEMPVDTGGALFNHLKWDQRWVRIRRPTIIVGGELTMDALEVSTDIDSGISEAPVQLKSNCGTLVIDDFGRQRMSTDELLNRWIVPLEKRYDFLNMPGGKKIQVPFDQLIVFSTNLEPKDLVDGAFLRRIPYKIEVVNPTEDEFRALMKIMAPKMKVEYDEEVVDYLIEHHYKRVDRPFACCQPRDLLDQIRNYCHFLELESKMTRETIDFAVDNYFSVM